MVKHVSLSEHASINDCPKTQCWELLNKHPTGCYDKKDLSEATTPPIFRVQLDFYTQSPQSNSQLVQSRHSHHLQRVRTPSCAAVQTKTLQDECPLCTSSVEHPIHFPVSQYRPLGVTIST